MIKRKLFAVMLLATLALGSPVIVVASMLESPMQKAVIPNMLLVIPLLAWLLFRGFSVFALPIETRPKWAQYLAGKGWFF